MSNKNSPLKLYKLANFTRNTVEEFEENIVTKHNYLESVNANLKNNKKYLIKKQVISMYNEYYLFFICLLLNLFSYKMIFCNLY